MKSAAASFPVVGIGASAGGVEALESFFRNLPPGSNCGFVVVTHLSPERRSLLPEIIARYTDMAVSAAADGVRVEPNQVYILPADAVLDIEGGCLRLRKSAGGRRERKPIDIFLSALAKDQGEYAVGIILSGGDGDGTLGVKAIKERGGLTLAQIGDGNGPRHPGMPRSAIASGMIDLALPANEMGQRIVEFARSFEVLDRLAETDERAGRERARQEICAILRNQTGHDFVGYKERTFIRRVQRRMQVNRLDTFDAYVEKLRIDPTEVGLLFRDLLINVTNFFRDADAFKSLADMVIPKLFAGRGADDTVRVWVPGCATGEEVFSIAILMREHMETLTAVPQVQIFATDIDEDSLNVARAARYPQALLDTVSPERRNRFFTLDDGSYVVSKDVRDLCVFSPHSVIRDPPFSRLDLVSCRNLLIYFGPSVQNEVIPTFHYALRPGGYLFLGTSENVTQFDELFTPVDKKHRIFRAREDTSSGARVPIGVSGMRPAAFALHDLRTLKRPEGHALRQAVEATVLDRFAPPHVVVNRDGDVVYYSARTGKYLEPMAGLPSRQLLSLARKGLRLDLRTAFREAMETDHRVIREEIAVENDEGQIQRISLLIEPFDQDPGDERLFIVIFTDVGPLESGDQTSGRASAWDDTAIHLEREVRDTRERLQGLVEEYETALEELKSSNEELVSVNEEYQSSNEELEAAKEELQSLNEELHTVNGELSAKVEALDQANSDLTNLFESTKVATVFLDRNMVIRSFTPAISKIFRMLPQDRGRPLTDLAGQVTLPDLTDDVRHVFTRGQTLERTIAWDNGAAHCLMRLVPYRNTEQQIEGVVLTFVDVTTLTRAEAHQRVLIAELNHRVKNMLAVIMSIAEQTHRTAADPSEFRARFSGRVQSMARSYELISQKNWAEAPLQDLIEPQLAPFGLDRVILDGPPVSLTPKQALSLGMIVYELATNAAKYGALLDAKGRVELQWREVSDPDDEKIVMTWRELDGPQVSKPSRVGFGLRLIEQQAAYDLQGKAEIKFEPTGLIVDLNFPKNGHPNAA